MAAAAAAALLCQQVTDVDDVDVQVKGASTGSTRKESGSKGSLTMDSDAQGALSSSRLTRSGNTGCWEPQMLWTCPSQENQVGAKVPGARGALPGASAKAGVSVGETTTVAKFVGTAHSLSRPGAAAIVNKVSPTSEAWNRGAEGLPLEGPRPPKPALWRKETKALAC